MFERCPFATLHLAGALLELRAVAAALRVPDRIKHVENPSRSHVVKSVSL
jgi:hypothetical protein